VAPNWYLERPAGPGGEIVRTVLRPLPFVVGRRSDSDLVLDSKHGSQRHAEFFARGEALWLRDLGSTNGTSINGRRIVGEHPVGDGDVVHFADAEFRAAAELAIASLHQTQVFSTSDRVRLDEVVRQPMAFQQMLSAGNLKALFQPLVRLADRSVFGYEVLGRGELDGRETTPGDLFFIAEKLQREVELSVAFRAKGLEQAAPIAASAELFINTHPAELADPALLLHSLVLLRRGYPAARLVLEIHEAAVADLAALKSLRSGLEPLRIGLAFDDFGRGQARLVELGEVAPDYLKFDAELVERLHLPSHRKRRELVRSLVGAALDLGIVPIAECIESSEEAAACTDLGFELGQGFYLGPPAPAESHG
jgi:EAL domain-containing protein (putative c-di-GMP-specific phosphodiesterase class I)